MTEEEINQIKQKINDLTVKIEDKFDELSKSVGKTVGEQKGYVERKVSEKPFAYLLKAFIGGVIVGHMIGRGKCCYSKR